VQIFDEIIPLQETLNLFTIASAIIFVLLLLPKLVNMKTIKTISALVVICTCFVFAMPNTIPPKYKNLKVLPKNISEQKLDSIMDSYNKALGVDCNFCHVKGKGDELAFEKDDMPEKLISRKMMLMTNDINKRHFGNYKEVSCVTCHNGKAHPKHEN
jgi:hypothetical protein